MRAIKICVFASHRIVADEFIRLLQREKGFQLVVGKDRFDVGVFDGEMVFLTAVLTKECRDYPGMRPLLVAALQEVTEGSPWLLQRVWGLVPYERWKHDLPAAVRLVAAGQVWLPRSVLLRHMSSQFVRPTSNQRQLLTLREFEVAELVAQRFANKEVASSLKISVPTVKFHVGNILRKLHLASRQDLVAAWSSRREHP